MLKPIRTTHSTTAAYQIKSLIERDNITPPTKYLIITLSFKYVPPNNSHITMLYTHRNPHSTLGTNIISF